MWDLLKKADIEQAKQELTLRRAETLRRQAEEGQRLDADRVELETLNELIDIFVQKHRYPTIVSLASIGQPISTQDSGKTPADANKAPADANKAPADAKQQRNQHQTVYASYMRATSRV